MLKLNKLQDDVLNNGETEAPFSGKLLHNKTSGAYLCAQCGEELFDSTKKFDSGSGWPSFFQAADGKVKLRRDNSHAWCVMR